MNDMTKTKVRDCYGRATVSRRALPDPPGITLFNRNFPGSPSMSACGGGRQPQPSPPGTPTLSFDLGDHLDEFYMVASPA